MKWITYNIEIVGITELLGGMPKTADLIEGQMSSKAIRLKAKAMGRDPEKIIAENLEMMGIEEGLEEITDEEKVSCGFRRTPGGLLCLGAHQIPSMLIDCATTLKYSRTRPGLKDLLTRGLQAYQHKPGEPLLTILGADGDVPAPTGTREWGSQVKDRSGSRAILRRYDYIMPWSLACKIRYSDTRVMTTEIWEDLWEMAEAQGLGTARPRGYGRFTVARVEKC